MDMVNPDPECVNRMVVYDAAPARVRRQAQEKGDSPVVRWWRRLPYPEQCRILGEEVTDHYW
jgi:hypothetical protein